MNLLPPVGWADVATKDDLRAMSAEIRAELRGELRSEVNGFRAELHKELRQQLVTFLTANAVLLGLFTAITQATS